MPRKKLNNNDLYVLALAMARSNLIDFISVTKPDYEFKWYHEAICEAIEGLLRGDYLRLMLFLPPQHGKSQIVSRHTPAYVLGKHPDWKVANCTYAADLALRFNRDAQRLIDDPVYAKLFPNTRLAGFAKVKSYDTISGRQISCVRTNGEFEIVGHDGSYRSVGVGGSLTGTRIDFGIIDDPIKDRLEAQSDLQRERLWNWYIDVFCTRLHNKSRVLLTMTRWHEDDLAGRILAKEHGWKVIVIPGILEEKTANDPRKVGEALWEERHSAKKLLAIKELSERTYNSMIQQRPRPLEGGIFKRDWFRYCQFAPSSYDRLIMSWDCAFKDLKSSDFVAGTVWLKKGADSYLIDIVRGQWGFVKTLQMILAMKKKWPDVREIYVEDKANGTAVIEVLKKQVPGIIPVTPTESKESRASAVSFVFESGNIYFLQNLLLLKTAEEELCSLGFGAHDDIADSITQALRKLYGTVGIDYDSFLKE